MQLVEKGFFVNIYNLCVPIVDILSRQTFRNSDEPTSTIVFL